MQAELLFSTFPCEYAAVSARLKRNDRHGNSEGNGGNAPEFCRKLFREGSPDHGSISGGAQSAPGKLPEFPISDFRWERSPGRIAMRGVPDLRKGVPASVHLYY